MTTLVLGFKKIKIDDKTLYSTFYSNSKAEKIINESDIDYIFESSYSTITSKIHKYQGQSSGWIIDSVIDDNIKYNPLAGSSFIKLPKELDHPRRGLINIQHNDDNKCFKWCLFRYLHPADCNPARITKADKDFIRKFDFKDNKNF